MGSFLERKADKFDAKGDAVVQSFGAAGMTAVGLATALIVIMQASKKPDGNFDNEILMLVVIVALIAYVIKIVQ